MQFEARRQLPFLLALLAPALGIVGRLAAWPVLNGVHLAFTSATPLKPAWS